MATTCWEWPHFRTRVWWSFFCNVWGIPAGNCLELASCPFTPTYRSNYRRQKWLPSSIKWKRPSYSTWTLLIHTHRNHGEVSLITPVGISTEPKLMRMANNNWRLSAQIMVPQKLEILLEEQIASSAPSMDGISSSVVGSLCDPVEKPRLIHGLSLSCYTGQRIEDGPSTFWTEFGRIQSLLQLDVLTKSTGSKWFELVMDKVYDFLTYFGRVNRASWSAQIAHFHLHSLVVWIPIFVYLVAGSFGKLSTCHTRGNR